MKPNVIEFEPIGFIRTPHKKLEGMPIQAPGAKGELGQVEVLPEYQAGLKDLDGFSHVILIYHLHMSKGYKLEVTPFLDKVKRGLFATRAPRRPNPLGLSIVRLDKIVDGILHIRNVDVLDGTPLLDIKPYVPDFDHQPDIRIGWLQKAVDEVSEKRSDDRFVE